MEKLFEKELQLVHRPTKEHPWAEFLYIEPKDIDNLVNLINRLNNISNLNKYKQPILFRGQADSDWNLQPKLCRLLNGISEEAALSLEYDSIKYFKDYARMFLKPHMIPEANEFGGWLALMQHYSAPTRMLDWTTSFNIALYFAVNDEPLNKPGAVWYFFVQDMLNCMHQQYGETELAKDKLTEIFNDENKYIKYGIKEAKFRIDTLDAPIKTERLIAQHGMFTYCEKIFCDQAQVIGHAFKSEYQEGRKCSPLLRIVINPDAKKELRMHLNKLNITAATLFPGIDGIGKAISEIIRVHVHAFE